MADEHEWWNSSCSARTGDDEAACSTAPADADESVVGCTPMSFGHGGQPPTATAGFDTLLQLQLQGGDAASRRLLLGEHAAAPPRHIIVPGAPYGGVGGDATATPPQGVSPYEAADNLPLQSFPGHHVVVGSSSGLFRPAATAPPQFLLQA
uniref:Uncharacterized protein n=1 Tax=Oryza punctata TaxID=4537 RepID=A0A0E0L4C7_ORYPU